MKKTKNDLFEKKLKDRDEVIEFEKDVAKLKASIEKEYHAEQKQKIKGYGIVNDAQKQWKMNHGGDYEKVRRVEAKVQAAKEKAIQEELDRRLRAKLPVLEKLHYGAGGFEGWKKRQFQQQKIDRFSNLQKENLVKEQKKARENKIKQEDVRKVFERQSHTIPLEQDNRAYRPDSKSSSQGDFKSAVDKRRTNSDTFNNLNDTIRRKQSLEQMQKRKKQDLIQKVSKGKFQKKLEQDSLPIIKKQPSKAIEQNNKRAPIKDLGKVFKRPATEDTTPSYIKRQQQYKKDLTELKQILKQEQTPKRSISIKR